MIVVLLRNFSKTVLNIGHNYIGHSYIGNDLIGHNHIGHHCVGHNCVGHNYICLQDLGIVEEFFKDGVEGDDC